METDTYGEAPYMKPYDDLDDVSALTGLPDTAFRKDNRVFVLPPPILIMFPLMYSLYS